MNFSDERKQRLVNRLTSEIEQNAHWLRLLNAGAGIEDLPNFNETTINRSSTVDEPEIVRNDVRPYPTNIIVDAVGHIYRSPAHDREGREITFNEQFPENNEFTGREQQVPIDPAREANSDSDNSNGANEAAFTVMRGENGERVRVPYPNFRHQPKNTYISATQICIAYEKMLNHGRRGRWLTAEEFRRDRDIVDAFETSIGSLNHRDKKQPRITIEDQYGKSFSITDRDAYRLFRLPHMTKYPDGSTKLKWVSPYRTMNMMNLMFRISSEQEGGDESNSEDMTDANDNEDNSAEIHRQLKNISLCIPRKRVESKDPEATDQPEITPSTSTGFRVPTTPVKKRKIEVPETKVSEVQPMQEDGKAAEDNTLAVVPEVTENEQIKDSQEDSREDSAFVDTEESMIEVEENVSGEDTDSNETVSTEDNSSESIVAEIEDWCNN